MRLKFANAIFSSYETIDLQVKILEYLTKLDLF